MSIGTQPLYFGFHHVQLGFPSGEEAKLAPYFVDILELTQLVKPVALAARGGKWFRGPAGGDIEFHLGAIDNFQAPPKVHPGIVWGNVATLEGLAERLIVAGYPVKWDRELENAPMYRNSGTPDSDAPMPSGYQRFYTACPFGNRLEFLALTSESQRFVAS